MVRTVDGHADTRHATNGCADHGCVAPTDGLTDQGACHGTQASAQNRIQVVGMGKRSGQTCQGNQQGCTGAQSIALVSKDEHGVVKGVSPTTARRGGLWVFNVSLGHGDDVVYMLLHQPMRSF
jgi:hypothetical protein